jgi:hypothetical protein
MNTDKPSVKQESPYRPLALGIAVVAGLIATILRIVPHPPNFSGVGGLGLFGGARLRTWQAYLLPLGIMMFSDVALWVITGLDPKYSLGHLSRVYVYASFMIYVAIGRWLCDKSSILSVTFAATLGGVQFFVLTNFCDWLFQPFQVGYEAIPAPWRYSRDFDGLITCFAWALGFYQQETSVTPYPLMLVTNFPMALLVWTVLGDVFFTSLYILVHTKLAQRVSRTENTPILATNA